jgi:hypothetical protein|nr:hypothetical protein [Kofleriaceae bacterium]
MSPLVIVLCAAIAAAFAVLAIAKRRAPRAVLLLPDLQPRLAAAISAFQATATKPAWIPAAAAGAPDGAAAIEAALIANDADKALAAAEGVVAAAPGVASSRVWLAWALCANAEPAAAAAELERAAAIDAAAAASPLAVYVDARARHLTFEHGCGEVGAVPPLVTKGDVAIVTLAGSQGGAAWVTGSEDMHITQDELAAAVSEHRKVTAAALVRVLDALDAAPGFVDAAYLAARLAVKSGLVGAGRVLFAAVAPRIAGRPDAEAFARDARALDDPQAAVTAALEKAPPPTPPTAKRSRSLKVL